MNSKGYWVYICPYGETSKLIFTMDSYEVMMVHSVFQKMLSLGP